MKEKAYSEFVNKYGAAAYLKLISLSEFLSEKNIDIKHVDKAQIFKEFDLIQQVNILKELKFYEA